MSVIADRGGRGDKDRERHRHQRWSRLELLLVLSHRALGTSQKQAVLGIKGSRGELAKTSGGVKRELCLCFLILSPF